MNKQLVFQAKGEDDINRIYDVDLSYRNLSIISPLKEFQKLRCLILSYNYIQRIQNLQHFVDLRVLNLQNNSLTKISGLQHNKNLRVLNLSNNRIEKLQNVAHLINLQTLQLDNNYIVKLNNLQYLKKLKFLYAKNNKIQTIDNLPAFSQLTSLCLSHNNIKNISNNLFNGADKLVNLDLSSNHIQNTAFLANLHNLQYLSLSCNNIKVLQVLSMKNLQTLQANNNQIQKLPLIATNFPQLITLNISNNMICSQLQLMTCLSEANSLIELDFRQNPMYSQTFQSVIQKIHSFDFLNGKVMTKAGAKYSKQQQQILEDLKINKEFYGEDDEDIRKLRLQGFFNKEPEEYKLKKNIENPTFYDDLDKNYKDFMQNDMKIRVMRQHYLKLISQYDIVDSEHILTQLPPATTEIKQKSQRQIKKQSRQRQKDKNEQIEDLQKKQNDIRKQNEKNLNKWKQLKNKQKTFKIRDVIKSRGKQGSSSKILGSTMTIPQLSSTMLSSKQQRVTKQLLRTQLVPKKMGQQLYKPVPRPNSMRKKE